VAAGEQQRFTPQGAHGMSSGVAGLDAVLGGLYWGDNVVWLQDGGSAAPFYRAVAAQRGAFDRVLHVVVERDPAELPGEFPAADILDARPSACIADPQSLLAEVRRRCDARSRTLVLFESLDAFAARWGAATAAGFLAACCPSLLGLNAIAYWTFTVGDPGGRLSETALRISQCVLRIDAERVVVLKAEGRRNGAAGRLLRYELDGGSVRASDAPVGTHVAASLRALRKARGMSQRELAQVAGVTPSAISQAERAARGLSLETLLRISAALGISLDDLVHGTQGTAAYRIGRRDDVPGVERFGRQPLLEAGDAPGVELIRLGPRARGTPEGSPTGSALVAVATGLVQVVLESGTPVLRGGEVLEADAGTVAGWRNLGEREASLFWIV
jgi:transcriptional regulator with XRE-family HTH domain